MKTLSDHLRDADPLAEGERLSERDAALVRRRVLAAVRDAPPAMPFWSRAAAAAAVAMLVLLAGSATSPTRAVPEGPPVPTDAPDQPRQLQFATPGGTRIIWVFDPDFTLQESLP